jgi:dihydropyrimidinase
MYTKDCVIKGGSVVTASSSSVADVHVADGVVRDIGPGLADKLVGVDVIDAKGKYVLPGGVDVHVHFGAQFGGIASADDYFDGGVAAACGGTTTVIDMVPQQYSESLLRGLSEWQKRAANAVVDYSLHPIVTNATREILDEIPQLVDQGYSSLKVFLGTADKHIDGPSFRSILEAAGEAGALTMVSAGDYNVETYFTRRLLRNGKTLPRYWPSSRPIAGEAMGTYRAIRMAQGTGAPVYLTHVSCDEALRMVRGARSHGNPVFGETCPQYLVLDERVYLLPHPEPAKYVLNPPLRSEADVMSLWEGLGDGTLQVVSSDHCPYSFKGQKAARATFTEVPNGLPGVETRLILLYHYGVTTGRLSLNRLVDIVASTPARMFGLYPRKGEIRVGADADIVIFDPEKRFTITASQSHSNVDYSPYEGTEVQGWPVLTMLRGQVVGEEGIFKGRPGQGRLLRRQAFDGLGCCV